MTKNPPKLRFKFIALIKSWMKMQKCYIYIDIISIAEWEKKKRERASKLACNAHRIPKSTIKCAKTVFTIPIFWHTMDNLQWLLLSWIFRIENETTTRTKPPNYKMILKTIFVTVSPKTEYMLYTWWNSTYTHVYTNYEITDNQLFTVILDRSIRQRFIHPFPFSFNSIAAMQMKMEIFLLILMKENDRIRCWKKEHVNYE